MRRNKEFIIVLLTLLFWGCNLSPEAKMIKALKSELENERNWILQVEKKHLGSLLEYSDSLYNPDIFHFTSFNQLVKDNRKLLFFKYSSLDCSVCADSVLQYITTSKIIPNNIGIITSSKNSYRNIKVFRDKYNYTGLIYLIKDRGFHKELDSLKRPYFFTLNSSKEINNLFIPSKYDIKRLTQYLDRIHESL